MDVIDMGAEREKRDGPDKEHVVTLDDGKWYKFTASYKNDDHEYSIHLWAKSMDDAAEHVNRIRETLKLDGQLYVMGAF